MILCYFDILSNYIVILSGAKDLIFDIKEEKR